MEILETIALIMFYITGIVIFCALILSVIFSTTDYYKREKARKDLQIQLADFIIESMKEENGSKETKKKNTKK